MPLIRALASLFMVLLLSGQVQAQSCVFTNTGINFGVISLIGGGGPRTANGSFTASCTGTAGQSVRICPNFNAGSGGAAASGDPRYLTQGAFALSYNLYRSKGVGQIWGSYLWGASPLPPAITVALGASGTGSASETIYGRLGTVQGALPTGVFQSVFSGNNTQIDYGYASTFNCGVSLSPRVQNVPFVVQATNTGSCTTSATALDFGNKTSLGTATAASNAVTVTCTSGIAYDIGLSNGTSGGTGPAARLMSNAATTETIAYGIYRDAAHALAWGTTAGSNTLSGIGTGLAQVHTGYGLVPAQTTPTALTYTDTVVVTVTY